MSGAGIAWGAAGGATGGAAGASSVVFSRTALVVAREATGVIMRQEQSRRQASPMPIHGQWMAEWVEQSEQSLGWYMTTRWMVIIVLAVLLDKFVVHAADVRRPVTGPAWRQLMGASEPVVNGRGRCR